MNDRFDEIPARIAQTLQLMQEMLRRLDSFESDIIPVLGKTADSVLIPVQILENAYTAVETLFLRISQAFENHLDSQRWHADLLEKMTLEVPGIRPQVLSTATYQRLAELMRFRHFKRYYFELDFDWRKTDFLVIVFRELVPLLKADLDRFGAALGSAIREKQENQESPDF
ncbi:MAG: hypothetical protein A3J97_14515 [Spirochaetes bacterium RIFOXYC1_FULL_54_7]|nr:MAG: hypothetical protein A3J97_14515 [Spirochaetes bacterium RIFOXYC1_FULL_54_7]